MKRGLKLLLPIVIVLALIVSVATIFTLSGAAADTEATLGTRTVTIGTKGYITAYGTESKTSGDFATLAAKLNSFSPKVDTRYTITLNQNITIDNTIEIVTNEFTEVIIDFNGYSVVANAPITVSGDGTVRLTNFYTRSDERSAIDYSGSEAPFLTIKSGSSARVFLKALEITADDLAGGVPFASVLSGALTVQSTYIGAVTSNGTAGDIISASTGALVEVKASTIEDISGGDDVMTAIALDGANGYIENSTVTASVGVSMTSGGHLVLCDATVTADTPLEVGAVDCEVDILSSRITAIDGAIVSGSYDKSNITFYYGSGTSIIKGEDPANYTVQSGCSFALSGDAYVMSASSTANVMLTTVTLGTSPVVSYPTSYDNGWATAVRDNTEATTTTLRVLAVLKNTAGSTYGSMHHYNEWVNIIIDFNGKTVTMNAGGNFDIYGNPYIRYDGEGTDGEIGTFSITGENPMYLRARVKGGYSGANEHSYYEFKNCIVMNNRDDDTSANYLFTMQQGEIQMLNVDFVYTGVSSSKTEEVNVKLISLGSSTNPPHQTRGFIEGCTFTTTAADNFNVIAVNVTTNARAFIKGCDFDGIGQTLLTTTATTYIEGSEIYSTRVNFSSEGTQSTLKIADSVITSNAAGEIAAGGVTPKFMYGEKGSLEIITGDADLVGSYTVEDGYALLLQNGRYLIMNADDIIQPSVTMPAIFANGMVLQRNKPLNVFGYCETDGAVIEVTLGDKVATATVVNGEWCATFEPMEAAFNLTLEVRQTGGYVAYNLIRFNDVNIGEIYMMAGQSNGDLATLYMEDLVEQVYLVDSLKNVRIYRSSIAPALNEQKIGSGSWLEASSSVLLANKISAIGYVTAAKIAAELGDVPVAIMHCARGSTKIKTWIDHDTLETISPSAAKEHEYWQEMGELPTNSHGGHAIGSVMYNQIIAPIEGFKIAGVLWYQGEGDTGGGYFGSTKSSGTLSDDTVVNFKVDENGNTFAEDADNSYTEFYYALEDCFRAALGGDEELPFYVMQLSPFLSTSYATTNVYNLKMEQYEMCKNRENTYLVSLATDGTVIEGAFFGVLDPDIGSTEVTSQGFIHPLRKSTVGIRTADIILATQFGIQYADVYSHPNPVGATLEGGVVTIEFDSELYLYYGDTVLGFELYDGTKWVKAEGTIDGKYIHLSADGVTAPTNVRYGCGETLVELGNGRLVEITNSTYTVDRDAKTITITYEDEQFVIRAESTDMIRTLDYGNITNASGVPMPIFNIVIEN